VAVATLSLFSAEAAAHAKLPDRSAAIESLPAPPRPNQEDGGRPEVA
jgi:hypothetical protein